MEKLANLLAQKADIEKQILEVQRSERAAAITKVRSLMAEYGLTMADLGTRPAASAPRKGTVKLPAKYRHPDTGQTWSGRGLQPNWLKEALARGGQLSDFKV